MIPPRDGGFFEQPGYLFWSFFTSFWGTPPARVVGQGSRLSPPVSEYRM